MESREGIILCQKRMFSGMKKFLFRVLLDSRGKYGITMTRSFWKGNFGDVISLKVEKSIT